MKTRFVALLVGLAPLTVLAGVPSSESPYFLCNDQRQDGSWSLIVQTVPGSTPSSLRVTARRSSGSKGATAPLGAADYKPRFKRTGEACHISLEPLTRSRVQVMELALDVPWNTYSARGDLLVSGDPRPVKASFIRSISGAKTPEELPSQLRCELSQKLAAMAVHCSDQSMGEAQDVPTPAQADSLRNGTLIPRDVESDATRLSNPGR